MGLALAASVWLRPYLGYEWWRRLHVLTLAVFALVTVHGLTTGSDTQTFWAVMVYSVSGLLVAALLWIRLLVPASPQQRRHPIWLALTGVGLFAGVVLVVIGPMRSGWNAFANGGNGSGQSVALASSAGQDQCQPDRHANRAAVHLVRQRPDDTFPGAGYQARCASKGPTRGARRP